MECQLRCHVFADHVTQVRCELMSGLTEFLRRRCRHLQHADVPVAAVWLTYVDRQLTGRGWQIFPLTGSSVCQKIYNVSVLRVLQLVNEEPLAFSFCHLGR